MARIQFDHVTKHYGPVAAVDDFTTVLEPGTITGFLGANGAGKSTTLRILLGLTHPSSGTATIDGQRYHELANPAHMVGAMTDPDVFHPYRSARNALRVLARASDVADPRVDVVLDQVGLTSAAGRRVGGFSMGMRQRLALAAALLGDPETVVLDEPANGLDPAGVHWLRQLLRGLAADGRTVFVSSHLLAELAQTVDDVVVIDHGQLRAQGPVAELLTNHQSGSLEELFFGLTTKEPMS
jgi:ABC-2 type transport system ATP-binding protein